ncbi:MAG: sensor histidine kinase [Burkholderiales bacterium]|nr:sensor histidine kinase [Burkholderiales bacterium]
MDIANNRFMQTQENYMSTTLNSINIEDQIHKRLATATAQALHDIQSPLMCLLLLCKDIPLGKYNINPNDMAARITGIVQNIPQLIIDNRTSYKKSHIEVIIVDEIIKKVLIEKQWEYSELTIEFKYNLCCNESNIAINGNSDSFYRMLSNLLNNAVDACASKYGVVTICLDGDNKLVHLIIEDNGKGMPDKVKNKILNNIAVTADKVNGQGIGFIQIRDTLAKSDGKLDIQSTLERGTKITLTFPRIYNT